MGKISQSLTFLLWCWLLCKQLAATDWHNEKRNDEDTLCSIGYRCPSGGCISLESKCNGRRWDCISNEDEQDCDSCSGDEAFYCASDKQCIPRHWRCDSDRDCPSGEDEADCPCEFKCEADDICISSSRVCNGYPTCSDGQDEEGCPCDFKCEANNRCINQDQVCNYQPDCSDGQDEDGCPCPGFICNNKQCVVNSTVARCDGYLSCWDGSDEFNCDSCTNDAFYCPSSQRCIPASWKCDGYNDCGDDEKAFCNHGDTNGEEYEYYVTAGYV